MKFPFKVCSLNNDEIDVFNKNYANNGKYIFEGVWFRSQNKNNKASSLWIDETSNRRRTVHFRHTFEVMKNNLTISESYLYLSVRLPFDEYDRYISEIRNKLEEKNYKYNGKLYYKEDLNIIINEYNYHPMEKYIDGYKTVDITVKSSNISDTKCYYRQLWNLQAKGIREKDKRGNPTYLKSFSEIKKYLPAQLELGCGPSIESGIEPLYFLHEVYKVQRHSDGVFYFNDDLIIQIIEKDEEKYAEFAQIIKSCIKAKPTKFHKSIKKLYNKGLLVGELFNNNFDHLSSIIGIKEKSLRVYKIDNYFPKVNFDKNSKSLIVIGSHADRRGIQRQAREVGLKIIYVDPEGFYTKDGFEEYPIEGARDNDIILKMSSISFANQIDEELNK